jgi:hypothetical protein
MEITYLDQDAASKDKESNWYHHCLSKKIPMVITRKRTSLGDVEWDYITMNPKDEKFVFSQEKFIVQELSELLRSYDAPKAVKALNGFCGSVKKLPIEFVNDFAQDVCNTLSEAYKRHSKSVTK